MPNKPVLQDAMEPPKEKDPSQINIIPLSLFKNMSMPYSNLFNLISLTHWKIVNYKSFIENMWCISYSMQSLIYTKVASFIVILNPTMF